MFSYYNQRKFAADYRGENSFWVVLEEIKYGDDNEVDRLNNDTIVIRSAPSFYCDGSEAEKGYFDFNGEFESLHAYGKYETLEEARKEITLRFGVVRKVDREDAFCNVPNALEFYKKGKYRHVQRNSIYEYCHLLMTRFVRGNTTDKEIDEIASDCESLANAYKRTLGKYAAEKLTEFREELRKSPYNSRCYFPDRNEEVYIDRVVRSIVKDGGKARFNFVIKDWSENWIYLIDLDEGGSQVDELPEYVIHLFDSNNCLLDKKLYYLNVGGEICEIEHIKGKYSRIVKIPREHEMYRHKFEMDREIY